MNAANCQLPTVRTLHLIPYMHPSAGGPPVVVHQWCAELTRRGWTQDVLTTDAYAPNSDKSWIDEYRRSYPIEVAPHRGPKGFGYSSALKRMLVRRLTQCDLVHVHNIWSYCNRLAAELCVQRRIPFLVSPHGMLDPHSMGRKPWKKKLYGRLIEWPALRKAAGLVFTHAEEERLARATCPRLPHGFVVPLATEEPPAKSRDELAEVFLRSRPELRDKVRIVFLSRLHSKKGLDLLLPAFQQVLQHLPDAQLVLAGPGEPDFVQWIRATTASLRIADRTVLTGPLEGEAKWGALAAGDVYVLPSYQENFAIALVEALRIGTPVVSSRRVNIWSDLDTAEAVSICELSADSVAQSILRLLQNPVLAKLQGQRGSEFAAANYTWSRSVDRLMEVYDKVVGRQ